MRVTSTSTSAYYRKPKSDAPVLKQDTSAEAAKSSDTKQPVEDTRPAQTGNTQSVVSLNDRAARAGDLSQYTTPARFGYDAPQRPASAADRVNVDASQLLNGAVVKSSRDLTPDQVGNAPGVNDILRNTPGGQLGASPQFQSPFERQQSESAALREKLGLTGPLGPNTQAQNDAAEQNLLNNWGSQNRSNPFAGGTPVTRELTNRFGSRTPEIGGDPAAHTLQHVANDPTPPTTPTNADVEAKPKLSTADKAGLAAATAWNAATSLGKTMASKAGGILGGMVLTVLTAPTNPEDTASAGGVFTKWAKGEEASLGSQAQSIADLKKKNHTERTTGDDYEGGATQETIDRFEAKRNGLVNPAGPDGINHAEAAARILDGARIGGQSVIRTTGEEAGQDKAPKPEIKPKDTGLTNPPGPVAPGDGAQPDITRPEQIPGSAGGRNPGNPATPGIG